MTRALIVTAWGAEGFPAFVEVDPGDLLVASDGGLDAILAAGLTPDWFVGDGDSAVAPPPATAEVVVLPAEKDDTDTHHAALMAADRGLAPVVLVGGVGGRFAHALANLHTLAELARRGVPASMEWAEGSALVVAAGGTASLGTRPGQVFSVFAWGGTARGVHLAGAQWGLDDATLTPDFPVGTSNVATGDRIALHVREGTALLVVER